MTSHTGSVIIPSYNGKNKILKTLNALEAQSYSDFETIVVIDGSTDGTSEFLHRQSFDLHLKVFEQNNQGRARVRNKGAKLAKGQILIFYDDDMIPESDSVQRHVNFHTHYKNSICGGNQLENISEAKSDFDKYRCHIRQKWLQKFTQELNVIGSENIFLTAANMSISKDLFLNLGGFDPTLTDAEDLILAHKALKKNIPIFLDKSNIGWHDDFVSCAKYISRRREYASNYAELAKLYPGLFNESGRMLRLNPFKKILFKLLANGKLVRTIDNGNLHFLPQSIRFKFYDLVITSLGHIYTNVPLT